MERHEWRNLRRRITAALEGRIEEINRLWESHSDEVWCDTQDIMDIISPDTRLTDDVIWEVIDQGFDFNRRNSSDLSWWLLRQVFNTYPTIQLGTVFSELINGNVADTISQQSQVRNMLVDFRWFGLFLQIPRERFDQDIEDVVLDCDRANRNFLGSIECTGIWQRYLQPIPYPETYRELISAILALGVNLEVLNPDLSFSQRTSRSASETSGLLQSVSQHIGLDLEQINQWATSLSPNWTQQVEAHWRSTGVRQRGFQDAQGRESISPPPRQIQYVDFDEYTPHVAEGPLSADIYSSFFDMACRDDTRLDALRDILTRYATQSSIAIPPDVLSGWRQGICDWLTSEQHRRSEDCSNRVDPFTRTDIEDIPLLFLWKVRTQTNHVHCFDLISLHRHLQVNNRNPLTQEAFTNEDITAVNQRYQFIYELMRAVLEP